MPPNTSNPVIDISLRRSTRRQVIRAQTSGSHSATPAASKGTATEPILISSSPPPVPQGYTSTNAPHTTPSAASNNPRASVPPLPLVLPTKLPGLTTKGAKLLRTKQIILKSPLSQINELDQLFNLRSNELEALKRSAHATLVFAQEEAGTAVCISPDGLLLTCSHCVAESEQVLDIKKEWWLLFADGRAVQAKTIRWDAYRDLALLRITAAQPPSSASPSFPFMQLASFAPQTNTKIFCIGHPGSEDLEVGRAGVKTGYDVLHISEGKFRGYAKGQERQDNSEIGALMHDAWTYWGHSGAPLLQFTNTQKGARRGAPKETDAEQGKGTDRMAAGMMSGIRLVGLHSSWDDQTGMRRGIAWEAVRAFLDEQNVLRDE